VAAELYLVKNKKTGFEDKVGLHSDVDGPLAFIMRLLNSRGGSSKFGAQVIISTPAHLGGSGRPSVRAQRHAVAAVLQNPQYEIDQAPATSRQRA
jgi:hypothetical protein